MTRRTALLAGAVAVLGRREIVTTHRKLVQRVVDFDRLAELGDVPRGDDIFRCLGTTMKHAGSEAAFRRVDFTYVHELAQLASRHRAGQFLPGQRTGRGSRIEGVLQPAERRGGGMPFDGVHIFRSSLLLGERRESRPGKRLALRRGTGARVLSARQVPADRGVAAAMIRIAKDATRGVHVYESDRIRALAATRS